MVINLFNVNINIFHNRNFMTLCGGVSLLIG